MQIPPPLIRSAKLPALLLTLSCVFTSSALAQTTGEDTGGERNISLRELNPYPGYDSDGDVVYNKMQIPGETIYIETTPLYNNWGEETGNKAWASAVGYVDGKKDGGINAGCIQTIKINGVHTECVYMFSVNTNNGRASGWAPIDTLSPKDKIREYQYEISNNIEDARPSQAGRRYKSHNIIDVQLPSEAEEWYLMPNRTGNAGKAKYYFAKDDHLYGLTNIPETGSQRYGVVFDIAPVGRRFWVDKTEPMVELPIYPGNSSTASKYSLKLVYGFFVVRGKYKRYCWTNLECLQER